MDVFDWHLQHQAERVPITVYANDDAIDPSDAELHRNAIALATGLQTLGIGKGDEVAIMLPTGRQRTGRRGADRPGTAPTGRFVRRGLRNGGHTCRADTRPLK